VKDLDSRGWITTGQDRQPIIVAANSGAGRAGRMHCFAAVAEQ